MKVLQAAALAAALVLLGAAAGEAGSVNCLAGTQCSGSYFGDGTPQSITWNFYSSVGDDTWLGLRYTFTVAGTPAADSSDFTLFVSDVLTDSFGVKFSYPGSDVLVAATCVLTFAGQCGLFNVGVEGKPTWSDGYRATIVWDVGGAAPPNNTITILKFEDADLGFDPTSGTPLSEIRYAPLLPLLPGDPGIGGRGNEFSTFGVFQGLEVRPAAVVDTKAALFAVPDPASSLVLLGIGLAGVAVRARRWKR